jgi:hypothetical protein
MAAPALVICRPKKLPIKNLDGAGRVRQRVRELTAKFPLPY